MHAKWRSVIPALAGVHALDRANPSRDDDRSATYAQKQTSAAKASRAAKSGEVQCGAVRRGAVRLRCDAALAVQGGAVLRGAER